MNIRDLEYLVALAEHQHFRKAAQACFVSQPTLSGQIRKLEDDLGVRLLERTSRKVLFTSTGLQLVQQAQKVLSEVKLLTEMASNQNQDLSGPLHLGLIPTIGPYLLPHIVGAIRQQFPNVELFLYEAQTHQLIQQLEEGKLDCIVVASLKQTEHLKEIPLYLEPMLLAVGAQHPMATQNEIALATLNGQTLLMLADGHCLRDQAMDFCFGVGAKEDARFQATSLETLRSMVAADTGITLLPKLAVPKSMMRDGVVYIKAVDPEPRRLISLDYRPGSPLKARYEKLAQVIQQAIKEQCELVQ